MHDPLGSFNRIRDFYISYLETAFYIRDPAVASERRRLLESPGSLATEPIIEPLSRYESVDFKLHELVHDGPDDRLPGLNARERKAFVHLVLSGLFDAERSKKPDEVPQAKFGI